MPAFDTWGHEKRGIHMEKMHEVGKGSTKP
jgi:hypothetical protein